MSSNNQFILTSYDPYLDKIELNSNLLKNIYKLSEPNTLKYIINVYIYLCNLFTYDFLYYINPSSKRSMRHTKISYLKEINLDNKEIVCFEFTSIFAYFLNSIAVPYQIRQIGEKYGFLHSHLVFEYNGFLIKIDPTLHILKSDFSNIKLKKELSGIECLNKEPRKIKEFYQILKECYTPLKETYEYDYLPKNKFNVKEVDKNILIYFQRLDLILKKINDIFLEPIDKASYFLRLMKELFKEEYNKSIFSCIVSNQESLVYIITIIDRKNYYFLYNGNFNQIEKEVLEKLFYHKKLEYINYENKIPGLVLRKI